MAQKASTPRRELLLVTGMSGAGRSTVGNALEDLGWYVVDNLPPQMLRPLVDLLPIAGGSGTLSNRFLDTDAGRDAVGLLRAKTGSLTGTNALAGFVTDDSGRVLTFSMISNNAGPTGRTAIDAVAAALRSCGCSR